jgi:hypothetical protein
MVDGRVVERPHGDHRFLNLNFGILGRFWLNGRPPGPLGRKWRPSFGKVREWYVESQHLQGCSPHICWLRTDGLAPRSKYWTYWSHAGVYGPSKPSNLSSTKAWLKSTASLVGSGEKLSTDPRIGQPRAANCVGSPFSQEQWDPSKSVNDSRRVAIRGPHKIHMVEGHTWTERGKHVACWPGFPLQGVHRFESPRLSDMSTACLWQSSHSNFMSSTWSM